MPGSRQITQNKLSGGWSRIDLLGHVFLFLPVFCFYITVLNFVFICYVCMCEYRCAYMYIYCDYLPTITVVACLLFYLPVFFSKERGEEKIEIMELSGWGGTEEVAWEAVRMYCINITVRNIFNYVKA